MEMMMHYVTTAMTVGSISAYAYFFIKEIEDRTKGIATLKTDATPDIATLKTDVYAKFDKVYATFDKVDAKFDKVYAKFDTMSAEMKAMERSISSRFDSMASRFDSLFMLLMNTKNGHVSEDTGYEKPENKSHFN